MNRRHRLGQHILVDKKILEEMVSAAQILPGDTVFELGVGTGNLTTLLCEKAKTVIGYEIDEDLCKDAERRLAAFKNLRLICGDGLKTKKSFDLMVSNVPYSRSRRVVEWIASTRLRRAVITVQKEFADKITASTGSRNYGPVSVLCQIRFKTSILRDVSPQCFNPHPKVSSTILVLNTYREPISHGATLGLKQLFSFRGRTVAAALKTLERKGQLATEYAEKLDPKLLSTRVEDLSPEESVKIASNLLEAEP
ncbi:MAG: ribosomal RNA small subunit methyltransferase A [Thaumarchaeota archaeon]|nr:ribosomal RNA small subunit methyltransferase A [Nitrososphaerota archaeon]